MKISKNYLFWIKSFLWILVLALLLELVLNGEYLYKNFKYKLFPPKVVTTDTNSNPDQLGEPNRLAIATLGISDVPIVYASAVDENLFQKDLQIGVVHYPKTAFPGEVGNVYIFGHSSDYLFTAGNYKTVFALLPQIKVGEQVKITNQSGRIFVYEVIDKKVVAPEDLSVLDQNTNGEKLLSLQTSYPVGTAAKRFVVIAKLEQ